MGNINISDLGSAGADLFLDSESYLNDLTEGEMTNTLGAFCSLGICIIISNGVCIFGNGGQGSGGGQGGNGNGGQGKRESGVGRPLRPGEHIP